MIKLLVGFLLNFPRICEYFFKVVEAYEKEAYSRSRDRNTDLIDEWLRSDKAPEEQDSPFSLETESPFVHRSRKGNNRRDSELCERLGTQQEEINKDFNTHTKTRTQQK